MRGIASVVTGDGGEKSSPFRSKTPWILSIMLKTSEEIFLFVRIFIYD